ncbi:MAG: type I glutamate--ammonia ligase [Armatimonadetes bacterium]|nr:type I glutamate--ammonia ligase [Armatimonadota bacterium]
MSKFSKQDLIKSAKEKKVRSIRLQFTDIMGIIKNVAIPVEDLESALEGKIMFDGSSIEGFVRIEESDMYLRPDPDTFVIFPWKNKENSSEARLICDIYNPDGTLFEGCPRGRLKKIIAEAQKLGYTMNAGPEAEFFLFLKDKDGRATTITHDQGGYFDLPPIDLGEEARTEMVETLEQMGFKIESSHHEVAPGQHEIDFMYADALTTADNIATFRVAVKTIALKHNLHATFMPKPVFGINGSGMHTHQSLFKGQENIFYDPKKPYQLSDTCLYYIGGLLNHVRGFTLITNPLINSYKRLVPGYEAPVHIAWSERNRSPLVRVPAVRGKATRTELRSPDPSCNPYLALTVMLASGLNGIEKKIDPGKPVNKNIYAMNEQEKKELGIGALPENLKEAIESLKEDELIQEALGLHIFKNLIEAKLLEWEIYNCQVHRFEIERYLYTF